MEEYKFTFKKMILHLKTIIIHKYYVFKYCCKCGIPWQGIIHDLSKFSPAEFIPNVKYVKKGVSPIAVQREVLGFTTSWFHHKGRNPHHYEYWMDKFDAGCYVTRIPYKYMVEMLCDNLGANKAYKGKNATYEDEYKWWQIEKVKRNIHPDNKKFLDIIFKNLYDAEAFLGDFRKSNNSVNNILNKKNLQEIYYMIIKDSEYDTQVKIKQPAKE